MAIRRSLVSPIDQLMPTSYIRLFLVIKTIAENNENAITNLQQGLNFTQRQLPYIGGQMFQTSSGRIGVEWEESGLPPRIQIIPLPDGFPTTAQLQDADHPFSDVWRLGTPNNQFEIFANEQRLPALTITCSPLDGYLVLGLSCFHSLWDIAGLSVFLHLWSKNTARVKEKVDRFIVEDLSSRDKRLRQALKGVSVTGPTNFQRNLDVFDGSEKSHISNVTLQFDAAKLREFGGQLSLPSDMKVSTNDLALAVLWTIISLNRSQNEAELPIPPRLRVLVDGRGHVFQPAGMKVPYMGNLVLPLFSSFNHQHLLDVDSASNFKHLVVTAIKAIVSSTQRASVEPFAEAIMMLDQTSGVAALRETAAVYNSTQLTSTSWSQAPMYVDFGTQVGKVEYVRIAPSDYNLEGMILTLPRRRNRSKPSDHIEIFIALLESELQELRTSDVIESLGFKGSHGETTNHVQSRL